MQRLIADVEHELGDDGRVLVRYTGTESKARVMIEGIDEAAIKGWADEIADVAREGRAESNACGRS